MPPPAPQVSVIIPNFNGAAHLGPCLASIARQTLAPAEVLVVDNASSDDSAAEASRRFPATRVLRLGANLGFAGAVNAGVRVAAGDWVAVLNNDTEVSERWLEEALGVAVRHPDADFVACRIMELERPGAVFSAGDCFLRAGIGYRRGQERADHPRYAGEAEVFAPSGCAALYRKAAFEEAGAFDEGFFAYLEDVDLGLRFQAAGRRGYYAPGALVHHRGGGTSGGEFSRLSVRLRTRNALLLLAKSVPGAVLGRSLPMIAAAQAVWLARCVAHGRLGSWLRGIAAVPAALPAALRARRRLRGLGRDGPARVWRAILASEALAREDFAAPGAPRVSLFLHWYFRLF
jgi:GT2 family glycosyltransferase